MACDEAVCEDMAARICSTPIQSYFGVGFM
jgi:hypothetical protein